MIGENMDLEEELLNEKKYHVSMKMSKYRFLLTHVVSYQDLITLK